jgi:hypothetical protein
LFVIHKLSQIVAAGESCAELGFVLPHPSNKIAGEPV